MKRRGGDVRCIGLAWVSGWFVAVFLPSVLITLVQLPAGAFGLRRLAADSWHVADEMAPLAKLMLGGLLLAGFLVAWRVPRGRALASAVAGVVAMLLTLLLIPADWSRGFGIGLTGERLSVALLPIYLGGAAVAGVVQALSVAKCRATLGNA